MIDRQIHALLTLELKCSMKVNFQVPSRRRPTVCSSQLGELLLITLPAGLPPVFLSWKDCCLSAFVSGHDPLEDTKAHAPLPDLASSRD